MDENRKIVLGQLIDFYREELEEKYGPDVWGVDQFVHNNDRMNSESICSRTTYYRLKVGTSVKTQTYYDLIRKLGYEYKQYNAVDQCLPEVMDELYQAVFYLDRDRLLKLQAKINHLFEEAKRYFYYLDIYKVMSFIIGLHSNELYSFNEQEVLHIEKVSKILECFSDSLMIYTFFVYEVNCTKNLKKIFEIYKTLPNHETCENPLVLSCLLYKYTNNSELEFASQTINKLKELIPNDNYNFIMRVRLNELAYIYNYHSSVASEEYQKTYRYIQNHQNISIGIQKGFHYNYAMYLFLNLKYIEAIDIFERFFSLDDSFNAYAEAFYTMCHVIENKKIIRHYCLDSIDYSNIYTCILKYCILKQRKEDINVLVNMIVNEINPKCHNGLPSYIVDFLRNEVTWIASQCKKYKMIADFEESIKR